MFSSDELDEWVGDFPFLIFHFSFVIELYLRERVVSDRYGSQRIKHEFIDITPAPFLARLERLDDRMGGRVKVSRRMLVG
jgi:hypothetical protein